MIRVLGYLLLAVGVLGIMKPDILTTDIGGQTATVALGLWVCVAGSCLWMLDRR